MLDPWIIEEIRKKEEEKRRQEEQRREQPSVPADDPREMPERRDDREMPAERKPGYEMPNPNETGRPPEKKKDDEPKRGVDISRITGSDEDDDGTIDIAKVLKKLEEKESLEERPAGSAETLKEKPPEKKPD